MPSHILSSVSQKEFMTQPFIEMCSTVVYDVFLQATDTHSAHSDACVISRFLPGGDTEGFQFKFSWGQTVLIAWLMTIRHH